MWTVHADNLAHCLAYVLCWSSFSFEQCRAATFLDSLPWLSAEYTPSRFCQSQRFHHRPGTGYAIADSAMYSLNARNHGDRNSRHAATSNNTRSAIHISQSVHFASSRPRKGGLDDIDLEGSHESMVMAPRPRPKSSASDSTIPEVAQTPLPTVVVQSATDASLDEREQPASPASKVCHLPNDLTDIETDRQEAQW